MDNHVTDETDYPCDSFTMVIAKVGFTPYYVGSVKEQEHQVVNYRKYNSQDVTVIFFGCTMNEVNENLCLQKLADLHNRVQQTTTVDEYVTEAKKGQVLSST